MRNDSEMQRISKEVEDRWFNKVDEMLKMENDVEVEQKRQERLMNPFVDEDPNKTVDENGNVVYKKKDAGPPFNKFGEVFLEVPFQQKNVVKKLGARWDNEDRRWFVPKDMMTPERL